jgi:hypothetical protein
MTEEKNTLTVIEAINEFYRLKEKYESTYYDKYINPILKSKKSKREKRLDYSRLPKNECINCRRNVGSIFSITLDRNELLRRFVVKCGDTVEPCPLDIKINYSERNRLDTMISESLKDLESVKLSIIREKNNSIFFNNNENMVEKFAKLTDKLKQETTYCGAYIEEDILKNDNPVKTDLLKKEIDEFGKGFIIPFKEMIADYSYKNDELIVNEAVKFYVNEMIPKLKEIQKLKYAVNYIEYDDSTNEYKLIQYKNTLENKESFFESDDSVVSFIKGIKRVNKGSNKTIKAPNEFVGNKKTKMNTKTKKLRPEFIIEEEEQNPVLEEQKPEPVLEEQTLPINEKELNEIDLVEYKEQQ